MQVVSAGGVESLHKCHQQPHHTPLFFICLHHQQQQNKLAHLHTKPKRQAAGKCVWDNGKNSFARVLPCQVYGPQNIELWLLGFAQDMKCETLRNYGYAKMHSRRNVMAKQTAQTLAPRKVCHSHLLFSISVGSADVGWRKNAVGTEKGGKRHHRCVHRNPRNDATERRSSSTSQSLCDTRTRNPSHAFVTHTKWAPTFQKAMDQTVHVQIVITHCDNRECVG